MKKLQQTLMLIALLVAPFAITATPVSAATCQVGFTGPDTNNLCVSEDKYTCEIDNNNNIVVTNSNDQKVASGNATTGGNGDGGAAQSGSVTNDNNVTFDFTIKNAPEGEEESICRIVMASTPVTPEQPVVEVSKEVVPAPEKKAAPVLAKTSANSTIAIVASVLGVALAGALVGRLTTAAIARRK